MPSGGGEPGPLLDAQPVTAYLDTMEQWDAAVAAARRAGIVGLDTETYGHDVRESSPAHRAAIHVWSIALRTGDFDARGYHRARGAVLPAAALDHQPWVDLIGDESVLKVLHNAPHDAHALANRGVKLRGWVDTLELARLVYPGRLGGYDLKNMQMEVLGKPPREKFKDVFGTVVFTEKVELGPCLMTEGCRPDRASCRLRSNGHGRQRTTTSTSRPGPLIPLETVFPGHERWNRLVEYAGADAVDSLELEEVMRRRTDRVVRPPVPWASSTSDSGSTSGTSITSTDTKSPS